MVTSPPQGAYIPVGERLSPAHCPQWLEQGWRIVGAQGMFVARVVPAVWLEARAWLVLCRPPPSALALPRSKWGPRKVIWI